MYCDEDMILIEKNLEKIKNDASTEYKTFYEPTLKEISQVYLAIKNFIKKKDKIVYGGFAQNILIANKNLADSFYKNIDGAFYNWPNVADIEFYSSTPLADIIELTEELYTLGFKHINGKEGIHADTYKIFVNFINYCDISYMPNNIYNNMPVIIIEGIKCAHPHFMMVDAFRVLTDPLTSYWRLDKSIIRFQKLLKYYPISQSNNEKKIELKSNNDIIEFIRKNIINSSKLIVVGFYAFDYYIKKISENQVLNKYNYYELISIELENDAKNINTILKKKYKDKITVKQFFPFFSFMDKRIEFYYNNTLILRLFGNNERCTVYRYSEKKKNYFGTFNLVFMYLLFDYFYAYISKNKADTDLYQILITKFYNSKNKYLSLNKLTVLDKSPFQDFTYKCLGAHTDIMRNSFLQGRDKKKQIKFRYSPSGKPGKPPDFHFMNISGNEILNEKYLVF